MLTIAVQLLCHEKVSGKTPKVIDGYTEAILMQVIIYTGND